NKEVTFVSAYIPLSLNFDTGNLIYMEGLSTLPLLDGEVLSGGGRLVFEFGKVLVDSVEIGGIVEEDGDITLYSGLNGNLYFDYGLYTNFDPLKFEEFEVSLYLFKYYGKLNLRLEGFYQKENSSLYFSAGYLINDKLSLNLESLVEESFYNIALGLSYSVVQGLNTSVKLMKDLTNDFTVVFSLDHSFSE
ncbi:MAG: hypothetical protein PHD05_09695, partial [Sphaerochaetaceae bacterium]|nr:hypothetical protein [Sphaerochaetaceae bacterium]